MITFLLKTIKFVALYVAFFVVVHFGLLNLVFLIFGEATAVGQMSNALLDIIAVFGGILFAIYYINKRGSSTTKNVTESSRNTSTLDKSDSILSRENVSEFKNGDNETNYSSSHRVSDPHQLSSLNLYAAVGALALLLIGVSTFYSLAYSPYKRDRDFKQCLFSINDLYLQKQQQISSSIDILELAKEKATAEIKLKLDGFLINNPEPPQGGYQGWNSPSSKVNTSERVEWEKNRDVILEPVGKIESEINNLKKDLEIIKEEKKTDEEICRKNSE